MMGVGMTSQGFVTYDNLFSGSAAKVVTDVGTLVSGQNVARGTVLGRITASGKLTKVLSTATDGSQAPFAVAADAVDAAAGDQPIPIYLSGEFNQAALTFGGTDTAATHMVAARNIGIFFKKNVTAGGTN